MPETVSAASSHDAAQSAPESAQMTAARQREGAGLSRRLRKLERVFVVGAIQGQPRPVLP